MTIGSSPVDVLLGDFEKFLRSERGLAPATLKNYLPIVRRFLVERPDSHVLRFDELRATDLHGFIIRSAQRGSLGRAKLTVTAMRSFLRFLRQRGILATDLAAAMPSVANWRLSHLPKTLPPHQVEQLLASCDRNTPAGQRDYAILLLLARLGLRGGEVVSMTLDDLIWECGEIVVRGKGQRLARMPLPPDVGSALANYLRHVRPACATRRVFIRMHAPLCGLRGPSTICCIVRRALKRAGVTSDFKGAHLLRHSLATDLLRRGASLDEIGQLLRHSQPITTQIYAKVDIAALRSIGLAWPGACVMSPLQKALDEYLAVRRALGHKLRLSGCLLRRFVGVRRRCGRHLHHDRARVGMGDAARRRAACAVGKSFGNGSPFRAVLQRRRSAEHRAAS